MLKRTHDAVEINKVLNHPSVFDYVKIDGQDSLDLTSLVECDKNVLLIDEFGGFLFHNLGEGKYEAHPQFLPEGRGKHAFDAAKEAVEYMFSNTDCSEIYACAPEKFQHSKILAIHTGFSKVNSTKSTYRKDCDFCNIDVYRLTKEEWRDKWLQEQRQEEQS